MGRDKLYRWEKRRARTSWYRKSFRLDILDWVMLMVLSIIYFISLRLLFMHEVISAPCAEFFLTAGQSSGLPPIFKTLYIICLLMVGFWSCVTLGRVMARRTDWGLISWHFIIFISLFLLTIANRNLTYSSYIKPPDGVMVVQHRPSGDSYINIDWQASENILWSHKKDGQWYARGGRACIWLDENRVSYNHTLNIQLDLPPRYEFILEKRAVEELKKLQTYRPLEAYERENFLKIKACQNDISNYGQPWTDCSSDWYYAVPKSIDPPAYLVDLLPIDLKKARYNERAFHLIM